jgi:hypothetical protein
MPFLPCSPYYRPSICSNRGAVTLESDFLLFCVAFRLSFLGPVMHSVCYGLDFTYTPSLAPHLRDTIKGEGHQLKLPGREISRGLRHNDLPAPDTCKCRLFRSKKRKH